MSGLIIFLSGVIIMMFAWKNTTARMIAGIFLIVVGLVLGGLSQIVGPLHI